MKHRSLQCELLLPAKLLAAIIITCSTSACHQSSLAEPVSDVAKQQAKELLTKAQTLLAAKKYDEAMQASAESIRLNSNDRLAYLCRGYAQFKMNRVSQSLTDFDQAVALKPTEFQGFEYRASAYQAARRFRKAIKDYQTALSLAPNDPKIKAKLYRELGLCNLAFGQLDSAMDAFNACIKLDPNDAAAYAARGMTELHLDEVDKGIADATEGIRLDPRNAPAYQVRSRGFASQHKADLAHADEEIARQLYGKTSDMATNPVSSRRK